MTANAPLAPAGEAGLQAPLQMNDEQLAAQCRGPVGQTVGYSARPTNGAWKNYVGNLLRAGGNAEAYQRQVEGAP